MSKMWQQIGAIVASEDARHRQQAEENAAKADHRLRDYRPATDERTALGTHAPQYEYLVMGDVEWLSQMDFDEGMG